MVPEQIPDSLFYCLMFFIPLLFAIRLAKINFKGVDIETLVIAVNMVILIAGVLTLIFSTLQFSSALVEKPDYERYIAFTRYTDDYSFSFWLILVSNAIVPQIMWIKKIKSSIKSTYMWFLTSLITMIFKTLWFYKLMSKNYFPALPNQPTVWINFSSSKSLGLVSSVAVFVVVLGSIYLILLNQLKTRSTI